MTDSCHQDSGLCLVKQDFLRIEWHPNICVVCSSQNWTWAQTRAFLYLLWSPTVPSIAWQTVGAQWYLLKEGGEEGGGRVGSIPTGNHRNARASGRWPCRSCSLKQLGFLCPWHFIFCLLISPPLWCPEPLSSLTALSTPAEMIVSFSETNKCWAFFSFSRLYPQAVFSFQNPLIPSTFQCT